MRLNQKGFTLIELMIVVAIIGILAAIAIPAYQDYVVRAQITEGLNLSDAVKTGIAEYYANTGDWASTFTEIGDSAGSPTGKYTSSMTLDNGTIKIEYGNDANASIKGKVLALQPVLDQDGDISWLCGTNPGPSTGLSAPSGGVAASGATTVDPKYLPGSCR